ncbi:MAG: suppressor of fused domain protein [Muribaculaceae bacterium]|nr:suppressor of fused domain protein [Muribaculaceae bacterium]
MKIIIILALIAIIGTLIAFKSAKKVHTPRTEFSDSEYETHSQLKLDGIEKVLGKSHDFVGHAIIPFNVGGAVDMYYFPNGIKGTGFATLELINPDGVGPIKNSIGTYELVAFTRNPISSEKDSDFFKIERRMCGIFTSLGFYTKTARIEPRETCEVPQNEGEPNICLIFDEYAPNGTHFTIGDKKHGLLLVIEIFPEEMCYAMNNGGQKLLNLLKEKGHYPYSDMNRKPVVSK